MKEAIPKKKPPKFSGIPIDGLYPYEVNHKHPLNMLAGVHRLLSAKCQSNFAHPIWTKIRYISKRI